jgi:PTH1 family peptidyl-tRNA hydrolase
MNESGRAVAEAARFYKVDLSDIVVAHDEIDLPPGRFRMKTGGGTGGHNGLKSVSAHMRDGYRRLRIGVGHPGRKEMVPSYVLHDFSRAELEVIEPLLGAFAEEAPLLVTGQDSAFASKVHLRAADESGGRDSRSGQTTPMRSALAAPGGAQKTGNSPFAALAQLLRK